MSKDRMQSNAPPVIVVCGMDFEAKIAEGHGVVTVFGQNREKLARDIEVLVTHGAAGLVSFGTAGGLRPDLRPGDIVVPNQVITPIQSYKTDAAWSRRIASAVDLHRSDTGRRETLSLYASNDPALTPSEKSRIWTSTGASAIDMESHIVAQVAAEHKRPFVVLRAVIDPADRSIPISALKGVREDGTSTVGAVIAALLRRPQDIPALVRLAGDASAAKKALLRSRQCLGPFFSLLDARKFALDVK